MSRLVCFIDDEDGQAGTCLVEVVHPEISCICCEECEFNPFPGKIVPRDRVLRKFTFDPLV